MTKRDFNVIQQFLSDIRNMSFENEKHYEHIEEMTYAIEGILEHEKLESK